MHLFRRGQLVHFAPYSFRWVIIYSLSIFPSYLPMHCMRLKMSLIFLLVAPLELTVGFLSEVFRMTLGALTAVYFLANKAHFTAVIYEYLVGETLLCLVLGKGYKKLFPSAAIHSFWWLPTDSITSELEFLPNENLTIGLIIHGAVALPNSDLPK